MNNSEELVIRHCIEALQENSLSAITLLNESITQYENSYVLHFLLGSELAEQGEYEEARREIKRSIQLNEDFKVARIQLAILDITHDEISQVEDILFPLTNAPEEGAYNLFAKAIICICYDDIYHAEKLIHAGVELNSDNLSLNTNMLTMLKLIRREDETADSSQTEPPQTDSDKESIQSALLDIYKS